MGEGHGAPPFPALAYPPGRGQLNEVPPLRALKSLFGDSGNTLDSLGSKQVNEPLEPVEKSCCPSQVLLY